MPRPPGHTQLCAWLYSEERVSEAVEAMSTSREKRGSSHWLDSDPGHVVWEMEAALVNRLSIGKWELWSGMRIGE